MRNMRLTKHETRLTKKVFADVQALEKKQAQIEKEKLSISTEIEKCKSSLKLENYTIDGAKNNLQKAFESKRVGSKSCKTPLKFLRKKVFKLHMFFWGGYRLETFSLVT